MTRRPRLTAEDEALWAHVKRSIRPLHPEPRKPPSAAQPETPAAIAAPLMPSLPRETPKAPLRPPLVGVDRRTRQKLVRGRAPIDARLDLHGLTQEAAHRRLLGFLGSAQAQGHRVVLVITGKGKAGPGDDYGRERGVLRRLVPQWMALPDLRSIILGFEEAHDAHGGTGAIYVLIRKAR
jgi:DNA-nicking Smr family endonuclease